MAVVYDPDLSADDPQIRRLDWVLRRVGDEVMAALDRWPSLNSPHEGKAVIEEELDELWEHVKANAGRSSEAHEEAIQVAAMAVRYVLDLRVTAHPSSGASGAPNPDLPRDRGEDLSPEPATRSRSSGPAKREAQA